jgi:NACalpha-BTF3-like transcription factor
MKSDKAKETLSKLGLKKVDGVTRVVIRKPKGVSPPPS